MAKEMKNKKLKISKKSINIIIALIVIFLIFCSYNLLEKKGIVYSCDNYISDNNAIKASLNDLTKIAKEYKVQNNTYGSYNNTFASKGDGLKTIETINSYYNNNKDYPLAMYVAPHKYCVQKKLPCESEETYYCVDSLGFKGNGKCDIKYFECKK